MPTDIQPSPYDVPTEIEFYTALAREVKNEQQRLVMNIPLICSILRERHLEVECMAYDQNNPPSIELYEAAFEGFVSQWINRETGRLHRYRATFHERQDKLEAKLPPPDAKFSSPAVVSLVLDILHGIYCMRVYLEYFDGIIAELNYFEHVVELRKAARAARERQARYTQSQLARLARLAPNFAL